MEIVERTVKTDYFFFNNYSYKEKVEVKREKIIETFK